MLFFLRANNYVFVPVTLFFDTESGKGNDAFTVDPVVVDEYDDIARLTGVPEISRVISFHPLNHKAVSRRYAKEHNVKYEDINLIVAHLGGGISVGVHRKGKIVDVNAALGGDGPYTPERAGAVPPLPLIQMCFSGKYTYQEVYDKLYKKGGVDGYLGTKDIQECFKKIEKGDKRVELILEGMAYQVAKNIGSYAAVLEGNVDAIIITGGIAYNQKFCDWIIKRVKFITENIVIYAGEDEMQALAEGVYDAVTGKRKILKY